MGSDGSTNDQVILATAGYDHTIRFWQAHTGICRRTVQHSDSQVNALEISPDRQTIAAAGYQHIRMYDVNSINPNPVVNYEGVTKNVTAIGFQEDGKWMFTGGEDGAVRVWDLRSRNLHCQRFYQVNSPVNSVCLHPNQAEIIVGDQNGFIHIWDLNTNKNDQLNPEADASIMHVCVDPEATYLASVNNKGNCYIWRYGRGPNSERLLLKPRIMIDAHKKYALKCKFSHDSTLLATTSADTTAKIWRTSDFTQVTQLSDPNQRWVWDIAFSADSQYVVTASSDNMARLWSLETGKVKREYSGHQKAVTCLTFSDVLL